MKYWLYWLFFLASLVIGLIEVYAMFEARRVAVVPCLMVLLCALVVWFLRSLPPHTGRK